jgi:hypothetical protein
MLQNKPDATPLALAEHLKSTASANKLAQTGIDSPNRLLYSLSTLQPPDVAVIDVAISGLTGKAVLSKTNWKAQVTVTVKNLGSGAAVPNATVSVEFQRGGNASCTTGTSGICTATSAALKNSVSATDALVRNVSGTNLVYDATQNSATAVRISK